MLGNADYIKNELPYLRMPNSPRLLISTVCGDLIGTKHGLFSEALELEGDFASDPAAPGILNRAKAMQSWIQESMVSLDDCVTEIGTAVETEKADGSLFILVMKSTVNIIKVLPDWLPDEEGSDGGEEFSKVQSFRLLLLRLDFQRQYPKVSLSVK